MDIDFPQDFVIFDLQKLIGILSLSTMRGAKFVFDGGDKFMHIVSDETKTKTKLYFDSLEFVSEVREINVPSYDVEFELTNEQFQGFFKASGQMGLEVMKIVSDGTTQSMIAYNPKIDTAPEYNVELSECSETYEYKFNTTLFKAATQLAGSDHDVKVSISAKGIMKLSVADTGAYFYIAMIRTS